MRFLFALGLLLTLPATAWAFQAPATETAATSHSDFQPETLVGLGNVEHGGYGGPHLKYTQVLGREALLVGGKGGWLINHRFLVGGGGFGIVNQPRASGEVLRELKARFPARNDESPREWEMGLGYGGVFLEYLFAPSKLVHATTGILIGGGGINFSERNGRANEGDDEDDLTGAKDRDVNESFFVVEPEVGVELNVVKFFRINLSASYRIVTGVNALGLSNADLSGLAGALSFKFGQF